MKPTRYAVAIPVTQDLMDDAWWVDNVLVARMRVFMKHRRARDTIRQWLADRYGRFVDYPPTFDVAALRPSLPYWPRPRR